MKLIKKINEFCLQKNKKKSPVQRYHPQLAGAIVWERLMYQHINKSIKAIDQVCYEIPIHSLFA